MIKIPDYVDCLKKFVFYFGLDYEAPPESSPNTQSNKIEQGESENKKARGKILRNRFDEVKTYNIKQKNAPNTSTNQLNY